MSRFKASRILAAAVVVVVPAIALSQTPLPGPPNMDELMRQATSGANRGNRSQRPGTVDPPGVPVPADSPLLAAFGRLDAAKSYRVSMDMSTADPRARQAMAQMGGMDHYEKIVVKPDLQSVTLHMTLSSVDAGKPDDWEVRGVIKGSRMARKFDTPAKARILAMQEASVARQLAQADMYASMSLAQAALGGPLGAIGGAVQLASLAMSHAAAAATLQKAHDFFEWTCADSPAGASTSASRDNVEFTDLTDLGDRTDGGVPVRGYRFYVHEQGRYHGPVEVDVARDSGLPTRFVISEPSMGATMTMRYADYDKRAEIDLPPCLKK